MKNKLDPRINLLLEIYDQAFDKPSWHGTNLRGSLKGLKLARLLWRPSPKCHNIWEYALHAAYWKYAVHRRMTGGPKGLFPRKPSNFPRLPKNPDIKSWKEDYALLVKWHVNLRRAIMDLPANRWNKCPESSKFTFLKTVYGMASHDLYHAGQIQLLKKLQKK